MSAAPGSLPRITVVMPSFNQARYVEQAIRSVLDQAYPDLEFMVMDGGSTDGSAEIIERYGQHIAFWRSEADAGQTAAIIEGWQRASGDVLAWLNSDDYYLPGALAIVGERFAGDPELGLLYGACERVDGEGRRLGFIGRPFSRLLMIASHDIVPQPSAFIRASVARSIGGLDPALSYAHDFDLFLRASDVTHPLFIPRPLAAIRMHAETKTSTGVEPMSRERQQVRARQARLVERPLVTLQPVATRLVRALPTGIRQRLKRFRPKRLFDAPADQG